MFLREENPHNIKQADIIVGLASYKEADSIAYPTQQADLGLQKYFPDQKAVILNCDNHSPDKTGQVFLGTETKTPKIHITTPPDTPGKGYNFENMFRKMFELQGKVLVCVDADLLSITPEWIKYLADPVIEGGDFVNPIYSRHKYDGTITKSICYPLIYGVFCRNIRQPIGGDFAMSANFAEHLIKQPWHLTTMEYGIDIFMTMNAVTGGFKICETGLGAKRHKPSAPKLGPMFIQVVSTAFLNIISSLDAWRDLDVVEQPPLYGLRTLEPPQELEIDRTAIEKQARDSFNGSREILDQSLNPALLEKFAGMFDDGGTIDISSDDWCSAVFEMIVAFAKSDDRTAVVEALKGLYFGRALSFMNQTWDWSSEKAEEVVLEQAQLFHSRRGELVKLLEA